MNTTRELSPLNRPFALKELAVAFEVSPGVLERIVTRHQIPPACVIAGMRVYSGPQMRQIYAVLVDRRKRQAARITQTALA